MSSEELGSQDPMVLPPGAEPEETSSWKKHKLRWKVACFMLAILLVLAWICIIVVLILKEKWQLVLVAWLLLYAAAHFCYWYCKRHSIGSLHQQLRTRLLIHMASAARREKPNDHPPSYDEVMSTEAPPPPYFTMFTGSMRPIRSTKNEQCGDQAHMQQQRTPLALIYTADFYVTSASSPRPASSPTTSWCSVEKERLRTLDASQHGTVTQPEFNSSQATTGSIVPLRSSAELPEMVSSSLMEMRSIPEPNSEPSISNTNLDDRTHVRISLEADSQYSAQALVHTQSSQSHTASSQSRTASSQSHTASSQSHTASSQSHTASSQSHIPPQQQCPSSQPEFAHPSTKEPIRYPLWSARSAMAQQLENITNEEHSLSVSSSSVSIEIV